MMLDAGTFGALVWGAVGLVVIVFLAILIAVVAELPILRRWRGVVPSAPAAGKLRGAPARREVGEKGREVPEDWTAKDRYRTRKP